MKIKIISSKNPPSILFFATIKTPLVPLTMAIDALGHVWGTSFDGERESVSAWKKRWPTTLFQKKKAAANDLAQIMRGEKDILVCVTGSAFQIEVWTALSQIPRGKTASYQDIAKAIHRPKACRAVANACGKNPVPVIIPCHRVVGSNGTLGGFSAKGGVLLKLRLLKKEG